METTVTRPLVDVVIPVYHPSEEFLKVLWMLKKQTVVPNKIILMITKAEGDTYPDFSAFEPIEIHYVEENEYDHGGTRNEGVRHSDARYVLLMTQDALPVDTHLIDEMLNGFQEEKVASVYARQLPKSDCRPLERPVRNFNYPKEPLTKDLSMLPTLGIKTYFCSNVAAIYDRDVFEELGGFIDRTIFNEDMIYAYKVIQAGYRICYKPEAQVYHSHNYTGKQQLKRNFDIGVSQADHPEIFEAVSSEKEGGSMVKSVIRELFRQGHPFEVFPFVFQCAMKYVGFRLGKNYRKLSKKRILRLTMNPNYWR